MTKPVCSVEHCTDPVNAKGLCLRHYKIQWRTGSTKETGHRHGSLSDRFWRHVSKGAENQCWPWTAFRDKDGYGKMRYGDTNKGAHIVSHLLNIGPVPDGLFVLHSCHNPPCVNPAHLRVGTQVENMDDRLKAGNCPLGERHPMAKISDATADEIRKATGTHKAVALKFGVSESQVGNIRRGQQRNKAKAAA